MKMLAAFPFPLLLTDSAACVHSRRTMLPAPTSSVVSPLGLTVSVRPSLDNGHSPEKRFPSTTRAFTAGSPAYTQ